MKNDKQSQKQFVQQVKEKALNVGYKVSSNSIYKIVGENFVHADYAIVDSKKIVYRLYVKKYSYDNIFWDVMQMEENLKKRDSLRAIGAFKSPSILIKNGEIRFTEDLEKFAEEFIVLITEVSNSFVKEYQLNEYVISQTGFQDEEIMKCLAHIDRNALQEAKRIACDELSKGNKGRFENEGKGFFELILEYFEKDSF